MFEGHSVGLKPAAKSAEKNRNDKPRPALD
jgi:hypothetical protein